tara:strand:+ start:765 stop:1274 length:510 start_codon:yes stop_codon:yes gene_type:complete
MADNYNPQVGIIQTSAHVAARIHAGSGDINAWAATFESVLAHIIEEVQGSDTKSVANTAPPLPATDHSQPAAPQPALAQAPSTGNKKQTMWDYLFTNPGSAFCNINDPRSKTGGGKGPDFRFKNVGNPYLEEGLWADSVPTRFNTAEGIVQFATKMEAIAELRQRMGHS